MFVLEFLVLIFR